MSLSYNLSLLILLLLSSKATIDFTPETSKEFCEDTYWKVFTPKIKTVMKLDNLNFQKPYAPTAKQSRRLRVQIPSYAGDFSMQ